MKRSKFSEAQIAFVLKEAEGGTTIGEVICPPLSGPETMIVWTTKGTTDAIQEAQAGRDYREAA
jgi:hypothetical protein